MSLLKTIFNAYEEPECVRLERKDVHRNVSADAATMRKLTRAMTETEVLFKLGKQNAAAQLLFTALIVLSVTLHSFVFALPAWFLWMWLLARGSNIDQQLKQCMGFIDGMLYTLSAVQRALDKLDDVKEEDPEKVSRSVSEMEQDLAPTTRSK
jgi:hypothetical protein